MDLVERAARLFAAAPALRTAEGTISFEACDDEAARIAALLLERGTKSGDIVAMLSPNTPEAVLVLLAMLKAGLVAAPLNYRLPEALLEGMIERLQPALVLHAGKLPALLDERDTMPISSLFMKDSSGERPIAPEAQEAMERPVTIIHTSASSGVAKAAVHSFANHWHSALGSSENIAFGPGECWLLSLPLYHIGGYSLLFRAFVSGGALAVPTPGATIEESLSNYPVTHLSLVPTQLYRLLGNSSTAAPLGALKAILLGGSAAPQSILDEAARRHLPLYMSYGSTEMSSQIATTAAPVSGEDSESGTVLPWREVRAAEDGELLVRGKTLFQGYLQDGVPRPQTDSEGWFHTSDIGLVSEDGMVTILGRKDNMFISGGENIHPEEIEKALMSVGGIIEAVVVPVPDPEYGLRPLAFIHAPEHEGDEETLNGAMRALVGSLKTPVRYERVNEWVRLPGSQKTDRAWYSKQALSLWRPSS